MLSGNRNFEARIHPEVKANYLASPPLVVAYALAGRIDLDLENEPLATTPDGREVFLRDLWPSSERDPGDDRRVGAARDVPSARYADVFSGDETWRSLESPAGDLYAWDPASTYVRQPPYFEGLRARAGAGAGHPRRALPRLARRLGDHRPHLARRARSRPTRRPAATSSSTASRRREFNSYGSRRGNHEVMVRGTFANVRLRNLLVPGSEGTWTRHFPSGEEMTIFDASQRYLADGTPLVVLAGKEYGTGSSRDWAAKGPALLGVQAVIAESYERIHRSNLLMMGDRPARSTGAGESRESLGLTGAEEFAIAGLEGGDAHDVTVRADGKSFEAVVRLDTPREREYVKHGGILPYVLRKIAGRD